MIDIRQLLIAAHESRQKQRQLKEANNGGTYRVGNSGCVTESGDIIGTCHRISHARFVGADSSPSFSNQIMFEAGEKNEDSWIGRLLESGYEGQVLRHDDCLVDMELPDGGRLVGHPDIVLADKDGVPQVVCELKGVYGNTTAVKVLLEGKPKDDNLIQAAAYSMALGIPGVLCYTSNSYIKTTFYDAKQYGVKSIPPFYKIFYLRWDDDRLSYRDEDSANWVSTEVTKQGIVDYYVMLGEMGPAKDLGPRPSGKDVTGKAGKWGPCGICDHRENCDANENNYDKWLEVKKGGQV